MRQQAALLKIAETTVLGYRVLDVRKLIGGIRYNVKEDDRLRQLISLWLDRPEHRRTENDVAVFYRWLEEFHSELLKRRESDPYQQLKVDLQKHIRKS